MSEIDITEKYDIIALPSPRKRDLFFTTDVDHDTIAELVEAIVAIEKHDQYITKIYAVHDLVYKPKEINIYIDSYGGMVYAGFGLVSVMRECTTPIHTIVTGVAMSCGFLIAISGHRRSCYADCTYMYHQLSSELVGTFKSIEDELVEVTRLQRHIEQITLRYTDLDAKRLRDVYLTHTDLYLKATEALEYGCVDHIIGTPLTTKKTKKSKKSKKKSSEK